MNYLKEFQKTQGTGLKGSGRVGSLITPPSHVQLSDADLATRVTMEYTEPGDYFVQVEGGQIRPATLRCGELLPYTAEEVNERKGTEYSGGRVVHIFRGCLKYGTRIREGPGSFHYGNGEVFEGRWKANMRFGLGALYLPSGYSFEGFFKDDKPHGRGVETFPFGEKYVGEFQFGRPHGQGILFYTDNGSRFEGLWEHGEKAGAGAMYYGNGDIFRGTWANGKREGRGYITYGATGVTYACVWHRDVCEKKMAFVKPEDVPPLRPMQMHGLMGTPNAVASDSPTDRSLSLAQNSLLSVTSPLGVDLRTFRVVPDLWTEVHPAHFTRIKHAFEALDNNVSGELEMSYLRSIWDPNNLETLQTLDSAAATVGADDTLELIEVLTGLYPHLPSSETRRWVLTDLPLEYVWRLRGTLADVQSSRLDGFYTLTGGKDFITRKHLVNSKGCVGGVRVSRAMFVRNKLINGGAVGGAAAFKETPAAIPAEGSAATAPPGQADATGNAAATTDKAALSHHGSSSRFLANAAAATDSERMTFPQLLEQVFPNLWKEFLVRCEIATIPRHALEGYSRGFDQLDVGGIGYLALESLKVAQKRFQIALSRNRSAIEKPENAYEVHAHRSIFKHQARWLIGDISVTITFAKQVDSKHKTGFVSLAEILRYAFPNVPCAVTKERLAGPAAAGGLVGVGVTAFNAVDNMDGMATNADNLCKCCICTFCNSPKYTKPRPPNPYLEGFLSW